VKYGNKSNPIDVPDEKKFALLVRAYNVNTE